MITVTGREFLSVTDPYGVGALNSDPECFWRIIRAGGLVLERGGVVGKVGRRRVRRTAEVQALRERSKGRARHEIQEALMSYRHLLPERLRAANERLGEEGR